MNANRGPSPSSWTTLLPCLSSDTRRGVKSPDIASRVTERRASYICFFLTLLPGVVTPLEDAVSVSLRIRKIVKILLREGNSGITEIKIAGGLWRPTLIVSMRSISTTKGRRATRGAWLACRGSHIQHVMISVECYLGDGTGILLFSELFSIHTSESSH